MTLAESPIEQIRTIDDYGFQFRTDHHWLPESREVELKRLELNQAFYREAINLGRRYPPEVNRDRTTEYRRIRLLKGIEWAA